MITAMLFAGGVGRRMKEAEMHQIAAFITRATKHWQDDAELDKIGEEVKTFMAPFVQG